MVTGGFGSYLIALDEKTYKLIGTDYPGNRAEDVKNPGLGWMIGFLFVVSFLGLFSLTPLRKVALNIVLFEIFEEYAAASMLKWRYVTENHLVSVCFCSMLFQLNCYLHLFLDTY
jgi:hypothetical protein